MFENMSLSLSGLNVEPKLLIDNDKYLKDATEERIVKKITHTITVCDMNYKTYTNTV